VLVRPDSSENVGAVARALRNTGLAALRLVAPGDWRTVDCWRTAWGAHEVLEQARVFDRLEPALADAHLSVAFSGRGPRPLDVREAAAAVAQLPEQAVACLVFGPESSGLSEAEIALCGRCASIPSHPAQPSLNLSHAVMVAAYEVFRAEARPALPPLASHAEKEDLLGRLADGLQAIGALGGARESRYRQAWRELLHRTDLTPDDVRALGHVAHKMIHAGRQR
jgi:TrmH family RNA methyltransferase